MKIYYLLPDGKLVDGPFWFPFIRAGRHMRKDMECVLSEWGQSQGQENQQAMPRNRIPKTEGADTEPTPEEKARIFPKRLQIN